jgi:hypothetical protein
MLLESTGGIESAQVEMAEIAGRQLAGLALRLAQ